MPPPSQTLDTLLGHSVPAVPCDLRESGKKISCKAKSKVGGHAQNKVTLTLHDCKSAVFEPDGEAPLRLPPDRDAPACDWAILRIAQGKPRDLLCIELKGSDVCKALEQIESTALYLRQTCHLPLASALFVLSGRHPKNASPKKQRAMAAFKRKFAETLLKEANAGDSLIFADGKWSRA